MKAPELVVSATPHIHSGNSVQKMMLNIIIALIPAIAAGVYFYGMGAVRVVAVSVLSAVAWQAILQKMMGRKVTINDLTAVVSGLVLAAILSPTLPWWMIVIATLIMILLGKEIYGGLGCNPFNGVLVAYVALRLSYPEAMIAWTPPAGDIMTELPPLQVLRDEGVGVIWEYFTLKDLLIGKVAGTAGEGCKIALLIGGLFLLLRRNFSWHIPVSFLAGIAILSGILWLADPEKYASPVFHLLVGGSFLAAFFLATDSTTSPVTPIAMVLYGLIAGMLTVVIRAWAQWEDGAYFAVLMISTLTPLLDMIKPRVYGRVKASASS
ncbi:MAG: RnfABCDGE type electron transport complex subunit D [Thermodesulfobacteriota bacterium]|nr:RnfABCDGE type electron transport complex subunit D [Thermodesulfobacteriota bacterium]